MKPSLSQSAPTHKIKQGFTYTIVKKKKLGSARICFKESNTYIEQGNIKLIKHDSKLIYNVTKDVHFKSFELSIHLRILSHIRFPQKH